MKLRYHICDVFTREPLRGNPLAVFPDAGGLDEGLMQRLAHELNLSETVFVQPATLDGAACRLRIFTPARELPFAGHPTVGTAVLLARLGRLPDEGRALLEEAAGPVEVELRAEGGAPGFAWLRAPQPGQVAVRDVSLAQLGLALGLPVHALQCPGYIPCVASCGVPFLLAPLRDADALAAVQPDSAALGELLAQAGADGIYLYLPGAGGEIRARMFAPGMGLAEDPATGAAAAALGAYLAGRAPREGKAGWSIVQGVEMGRPSRIELELEKRGGKLAAVRVGGHAVVIGEAELTLEFG